MNRARVVIGVGGTLGHDSNAALLVDGRLVAASQEERYTRLKHDGAFPEHAIRDCLATVGLSIADVDVCVIADKPLQEWLANSFERPSNPLTWQLGRMAPPAAFHNVASARRLMPRATMRYAWHHLSHAALAFATSPYERAAFLCVDGAGDDVNATIGIADARRTEVRYELPYVNGLGFLYLLVTEHLGFSFGSEYKVMGLAPYGAPVLIDRLRAFSRSDDNGALRFNHDRLSWPRLLQSFAAHLGLPARLKTEAINADHANLAASVQALFEEEVFRMVAFAKRVTGESMLLFSGGCAQNCVAAGKLKDLGVFEDVFVSPAAGDMGIGLGAALLHRQRFGSPGDGKVDAAGMMLGSLPGAVPSGALPHEVPHHGDVFAATARLLAEGKMVGWVRGRMELGPRALGARSILADARVHGMQSALNETIKFRESFRPFAPAILAEDCAHWFDSPASSDYMQITAPLKMEHRYATGPVPPTWQERLAQQRCEISSVVHVDYSARLQTVRRERHPDLHRLLTEFKAITGMPLLVNTSFNVSGEPIVRTAADAWECFRNTGLDYLVVDDRLFRHPNDSSDEDKRAWLNHFTESA